MRFVRELGATPKKVDLEQLRETVDSFPVRLVVVFGSIAVDEPTSLSDLDVAVQVESHISQSRKVSILGTLRSGISTTTGIDAVDLVDLDVVGPAIGYDVLANGVVVYGDRADAVALRSKFQLMKLDLQPVKREWDDALSRRIEEGSFARS